MRHFLVRWLVTTIAVMVASSVIHGIRYDSTASLIGAALLLGIPTLMNLVQQVWSTEAGAQGPIVLFTGVWLVWRKIPSSPR